MNIVFQFISTIEKSSKEFKFFWSFDFKWSNDNNDEKASKCDDSIPFEFFFKEEFSSFWISFSVLRINIVISFDVTTIETTTTKKRAKATLTKTKRTRKIFRTVFSIEMFKNEISKSIIIAKKKIKENTKKKIMKQLKKILLRLLIEC